MAPWDDMLPDVAPARDPRLLILPYLITTGVAPRCHEMNNGGGGFAGTPLPTWVVSIPFITTTKLVGCREQL